MKPDLDLDAVLEKIIALWGVPGLAVGIVEHNEIVYARGFGVQNLEIGTPVTPDTFFCIASITKCFVAAAVMQLVERGKLHLDAPLVEYLPYFRLDDERYRQITLRQMLSHTSGMPDMDEAEYDELVAHPEYDDGAPERFVRTLASRKMIAAPGERFAYSNIAYNVLGHLLAKITGQPFEDHLQEQLLRPAGMHESTLLVPAVPRERLAMPHLRTPAMIVNPLYPYHRADAPASFMHSTVQEMCQWAIACLNGGINGGQRILSQDSFELMWNPVARRNYPPFREEMGLGWTLGHFEGVRTVGHGGGGFGWTCFLVLLPGKNSAAIILSNEESSAHDLALRAVVRTMLGQEPQPGAVSWMVPISQALQSGGIREAYACYEEIKGNPDYVVDDDELISLVHQMMSVKKFDLAKEVLELNLRVFPEHLGSYVLLAKVCLRLEDRDQAAEVLRKALILDPKNSTAAKLMEEIR